MSITDLEATNTSTLLAELGKGAFDFLDLGCSNGGSMTMAQHLFDGKRGLGIDIAENKIAAAVAAGHEAIVCDIHKLPQSPLVRFCVMSHFLEHIPDRRDVIFFLAKATLISKEFVFIRQPYFDADGYLFQKGLKIYWSDWHGHPNTMSTLDFHSVLKPLQNSGIIGTFSIHLADPIRTSSHAAIHAVDSPRDQHEYDATVHPPKKMDVPFDMPVFSEVMVFITKPGINHHSCFSRVKFDRTVFDSSKPSMK